MKPTTHFAILAALIATTSPLSASEIQLRAENPVIELSVTEQVDSEPDQAVFSTGVETRAATASAALRQNSQQAGKVIAQLRSLGIAAEDIQTTGINLSADYQYDRARQTNRFVGYRVSNQVRATVKDIDRLGAILDALVTAGGATNLSGPFFSLQDDSEARQLARERALQAARKRAESYARASGYAGVRLRRISEAISHAGPGPVPIARQMAAVEESVPIAPGQVGTAVNLNISYEMTR